MNRASIQTLPTLPLQLQSFICKERYELFFRQACSNKRTTTVVCSIPVDCDDPLPWFAKIKHAFDFHYYWQQPSSRTVIIGLGSARNISSQGQNRFSSLQDQLEKALHGIEHLNLSNDEAYGFPFVGAGSFFDEISGRLWHGFKAAALTLPQLALVKTAHHTTMSVAIPVHKNDTKDQLFEHVQSVFADLPDPSSIKSWKKSSPSSVVKPKNTEASKKQWIRMIEKAKQHIANGELQKVVLARSLRLKMEGPLEPADIIHYLREHYPRCYTFLFKTKHSGTFLGSTPELLLSVDGSEIKTEALAGSMGRGKNKNQDKKFEQALLNSTKDQSEHQFVIDKIKNSLDPLVHNVRLSAKPGIKKLANVQHLFTPVKAQLNKNRTALQALGALHPTPAVGGVPRAKALPYIRENERFERGLFASPIGWITSNHQASFAVALRSGLLHNQQAHLFAGCGIVLNSDSQKEWEESELKLRPLLSALNRH